MISVKAGSKIHDVRQWREVLTRTSTCLYLCRPLNNFIDQCAGSEVEGACKIHDDRKRWLPLASFQQTDIRSIDIARDGNIFLGEPFLHAMLEENPAKDDLQPRGAVVHGLG